MTPWLTKSDFKAATACPTKLYYKKHKYPSTCDDDPYLEFLADGGYMVGRMAQLYFPGGVLIETIDPAQAVKDTTATLARGVSILFEAAIEWNGCLIRADVLRFEGRSIDLIEVKSKGYDRAEGFFGDRGAIRAKWLEYVQDVAFQRWVIRNAFPGYTVRAFLMTPDKGVRSPLDQVPSMFALRRDAKRVITVDFNGDEAAIRASGLLGLWPAEAAADAAHAEVVKAAEYLLSYLRGGLRRPPSTPGYRRCKDCEYRIDGPGTPNGFNECWGKLADVRPFMFDLTYLGNVKVDGEVLAERLIERGTVSLYDIPSTALKGAYAVRQRRQIEFTRQGIEFRSPQLRPVLQELKYPLHFVDFETSRLALPYHRGMRPWEQVAFQWSCHTIRVPGAEVEHFEWINLDDGCPNVGFAESLRAAIGDAGTIFTWSNHEETTLKDVARQMADYGQGSSDLGLWLRNTATGDRIFDLCKHAREHFFTPQMKGSASIKDVLPAIWRSNPRLRSHRWFSRYAREENGAVLNPYATLTTIDIFERAEVVEEGTGAMSAYQEMLYGAGRCDASVKDGWRRLLLQYCALDTLAMIVIWMDWMEDR